MTTITEEDFQEAETLWDLERLYTDLGEVKGESLTATEQLTLRGLLCGYTPAELAEVRVKDKRGQQTNVSRGVRGYVKKLMKIKGVAVPERLNSKEMLARLKQTGYKKQLTALKGERILPIRALEGLIKVIGVNKSEINHQVTIEMNIRLVTSLPMEEIAKRLTGLEGSGGKEKE